MNFFLFFNRWRKNKRTEAKYKGNICKRIIVLPIYVIYEINI